LVAPPAGAWIETIAGANTVGGWCVAPPAGAWIETQHAQLKAQLWIVAPPAGAWIETRNEWVNKIRLKGRAPCGRVD